MNMYSVLQQSLEAVHSADSSFPHPQGMMQALRLHSKRTSHARKYSRNWLQTVDTLTYQRVHVRGVLVSLHKGMAAVGEVGHCFRVVVETSPVQRGHALVVRCAHVHGNGFHVLLIHCFKELQHVRPSEWSPVVPRVNVALRSYLEVVLSD